MLRFIEFPADIGKSLVRFRLPIFSGRGQWEGRPRLDRSFDGELRNHPGRFICRERVDWLEETVVQWAFRGELADHAYRERAVSYRRIADSHPGPWPFALYFSGFKRTNLPLAKLQTFRASSEAIIGSCQVVVRRAAPHLIGRCEEGDHDKTHLRSVGEFNSLRKTAG